MGHCVRLFMYSIIRILFWSHSKLELIQCFHLLNIYIKILNSKARIHSTGHFQNPSRESPYYLMHHFSKCYHNTIFELCPGGRLQLNAGKQKGVLAREEWVSVGSAPYMAVDLAEFRGDRLGLIWAENLFQLAALGLALGQPSVSPWYWPKLGIHHKSGSSLATSWAGFRPLLGQTIMACVPTNQFTTTWTLYTKTL